MTIVVERNDGSTVIISSQTHSWISLCRLFKMSPPVLSEMKLAIEGEAT